MKTFREFILECELVEGKVEWDNLKDHFNLDLLQGRKIE